MMVRFVALAFLLVSLVGCDRGESDNKPSSIMGIEFDADYIPHDELNVMARHLSEHFTRTEDGWFAQYTGGEYRDFIMQCRRMKATVLSHSLTEADGLNGIWKKGTVWIVVSPYRMYVPSRVGWTEWFDERSFSLDFVQNNKGWTFTGWPPLQALAATDIPDLNVRLDSDLRAKVAKNTKRLEELRAKGTHLEQADLQETLRLAKEYEELRTEMRRRGMPVE